MSASTESLHLGRWWQPLADGRLWCQLCPRECKLGEGQRGFCYVRQNVSGQMRLTAYGRSSGLCLDPIEKKPLYHFYPGTRVLSFGTAGCNLGCRFCQNWEISKARASQRLTEAATPGQIASSAQRLGSRSVAFTYNDPVVFAEYAMDVAEACREAGVATVAVTAGYISAAARPAFFAHMDAANVDLKGFSEGFYRRLCVGELAPVLETLEFLHRETQVWLEVTTLLIPGENDSEAELDQASDWVAEHLGPDVPWHFTAFHPDFKMRDKTRTPAATLAKARRLALTKGLHYVYTGNVRDPDGATTACPGCGKCVVARDGYQVEDYQLDGCRCRFCACEIAGRFDPEPQS